MSTTPCALCIDDFVTVLPVPPQTETRRGVIRFIGETHFSSGRWIGVELVGSLGRNSGTVQGETYFTCLPGQGVFVRPELVVPFVKSEKENAEKCGETFGAAPPSEALFSALQKECMRLQKELERREKMPQRFPTPPRAEKTVRATHVKETQCDAPDELLRLRSDFAELRVFCAMQEDELRQQTQHAEILHQTLQRLEAEQNAPPNRETFHFAHEREALRQLKLRYDELFAAREKERSAANAQQRKAAEEYEEALAQQRNAKERTANEMRALRQREEKARAELAHMRATHAPISVTEREMQSALVRSLQSELMTSHARKFAQRYNCAEKRAAAVSPAEALAATAKALSAAGTVMSFATPEACRSARMKLFGWNDAVKRKGNDSGVE